MSLFDQLAAMAMQALGGGQQAAQSPLMGLIGQMLSGQAPGVAAQGENPLAALLARFQQAGLGDVAQSWVGTGENAPVEPEALEGVFGAETVSAWSQQTGLDQSSLLGGLAQLLPQVIDKMTPQGQLPQGDAMQQLLAGFFGRQG